MHGIQPYHKREDRRDPWYPNKGLALSNICRASIGRSAFLFASTDVSLVLSQGTVVGILGNIDPIEEGLDLPAQDIPTLAFGKERNHSIWISQIFIRTEVASIVWIIDAEGEVDVESLTAELAFFSEAKIGCAFGRTAFHGILSHDPFSCTAVLRKVAVNGIFGTGVAVLRHVGVISVQEVTVALCVMYNTWDGLRARLACHAIVPIGINNGYLGYNTDHTLPQI